MPSNKKSGAQAPGLSAPHAADLTPTKDEAPAVGAARGFKNQNTGEQPDSPREFSPEQALKTLQHELRTLKQPLRTLQYNEGRRLVRAYLTRLRSRKVAPEEELAITVASMRGYTLVIFCRFLEHALLEGLSAKAQVVELREQIDPEEERFEDLAVRFARAGCALLRKKTVGYQTVYRVVCFGRVIETLNGIDAAERFLQLNTIGDSHAAT